MQLIIQDLVHVMLLPQTVTLGWVLLLLLLLLL
jgi:hypothetical protein